MTIWFSRELPLFDLKLLDKWSARIGLPCDKLWPFEFLESFRCSISSVSIYYAPESDFRVTSYDHLNFSRAFIVQFRASRYIMRLNQTSVWQVMTIWISREHLVFNSEHLDKWCARIGLPCDKFDNWNLSRVSDVQFLPSRCIMPLNRTFVWQVMNIYISGDHTLFNSERVDILCTWIERLCDKFWPFEFLESFRCSIWSFSISDVLESDFRVTSYDHLNFSRAFVVQFRASRYIMRLNRTSVWQVMTIWISLELPVFHSEHL